MHSPILLTLIALCMTVSCVVSEDQPFGVAEGEARNIPFSNGCLSTQSLASCVEQKALDSYYAPFVCAFERRTRNAIFTMLDANQGYDATLWRFERNAPMIANAATSTLTLAAACAQPATGPTLTVLIPTAAGCAQYAPIGAWNGTYCYWHTLNPTTPDEKGLPRR